LSSKEKAYRLKAPDVKTPWLPRGGSKEGGREVVMRRREREDRA